MISIKTPEEIKIMAEGGKILAKIMKELEKKARPGIATKELDRVAEALILKSGNKCSFKRYRGFPACLCTSINEEIVHAVPSERVLKEGDILSLDLGLKHKGFHTDMALTLPLGKVSGEVLKLIEVTKKALEAGIKKAKPGNTFGDIGNAVQKYVEFRGFTVIKELCGHGIGRAVHEDPDVLNFGEKGTGPEIQEGMTFCIETLISTGDWRIKRSKNGQAWETADGSLSCHFEHTLAVMKNGVKILTVIK